MTISEELLKLVKSKQAIKTALTNKGIDMTGVTFDKYADKILSITTSDPDALSDKEKNFCRGMIYSMNNLFGQDTYINGAVKCPFDLSHCVSAKNTYQNNKGLTSVTGMSSMPYCTTAYYVFNGCSSLIETDLDTSSCTTLTGAFGGCTSLETLCLDFSSVTSLNYCFVGCENLTNLTFKGNAFLPKCYSLDLSSSPKLNLLNMLNSIKSIGARTSALTIKIHPDITVTTEIYNFADELKITLN